MQGEYQDRIAASEIKLEELKREHSQDRQGLRREYDDLRYEHSILAKDVLILVRRAFEIGAQMMAVKSDRQVAFLPPLNEKLVGEWRRALLESAVKCHIRLYGEKVIQEMPSSFSPNNETIFGRRSFRDVLKKMSRDHAYEIDRRDPFGIAIAQLQSWVMRQDDESTTSQPETSV
jgi:hypothetical protein